MNGIVVVIVFFNEEISLRLVKNFNVFKLNLSSNLSRLVYFIALFSGLMRMISVLDLLKLLFNK